MNTMESDGFTAGLKCTCRVSVLVVWLLFSWVPGSNPELRGAPPGCLFPDFLQSHEPGMGDWTWKYDGDTHVGHVTNGVYTICSKRYKEELGLTGERMRDSCEETRLIRTCVKKFGPNTFAVKHGGTTRGHTTSYQCIRYVMRSATVIQLAVSDRKSNVSGICDLKLTLDHSPWISVKHFRTAVSICPFTGGYNFMDLKHFTRDHAPTQLCKNMAPPVRVESDCVEKEGVNFHFRHQRCVPSGSFFRMSQSLVCMASWNYDGYGFALLRKGEERSFYCMRVKFHKSSLEVEEVVVYLDWKCYRATDLTGFTGRLSYSTPYVIFRKPEKRLVTLPCMDELSSCTNKSGVCEGHHCMQTCRQCVNTTAQSCHFGRDVMGTWVIHEPGNVRTKLKIHRSSMNHSSLGLLKCVTFEGQRRAAFKAILWGTYQNGCYPRFLCMYFDSPAANVLRYKMGSVLQWPLELDDRIICSEKNFEIVPDFKNPTDRYMERPWNVALQATKEIPGLPCIFPKDLDLPNYASFVDDQGRTGCITLKSSQSPKYISMVYVHQTVNPSNQATTYHRHSRQHNFHCFAAMTYMDSFKTVLTLTKDHKHEALCWMFVDSRTIVVVQTSACNKVTALGILRDEPKYTKHLKWRLNLGATNKEVSDVCDALQIKAAEEWICLLHGATTDEQKVGASSNVTDRLQASMNISLICVLIVLILHTTSS